MALNPGRQPAAPRSIRAARRTCSWGWSSRSTSSSPQRASPLNCSRVRAAALRIRGRSWARKGFTTASTRGSLTPMSPRASRRASQGSTRRGLLACWAPATAGPLASFSQRASMAVFAASWPRARAAASRSPSSASCRVSSRSGMAACAAGASLPRARAALRATAFSSTPSPLSLGRRWRRACCNRGTASGCWLRIRPSHQAP